MQKKNVSPDYGIALNIGHERLPGGMIVILQNHNFSSLIENIFNFFIHHRTSKLSQFI